MQERQALAELLSRVMARARRSGSEGRKVPVFLKIAPDLGDAELADIAAEVLASKVDGVIVSNTTIARTGLHGSAHRDEAGGLSGRPLFERSTAVLARMRRLLGPDVALIGVGGVDSTEAALEKIRAGADLVQLYTGMIYAGPSLPGRIVSGLAAFCEREKIASIAELRDSGVDRWAEQTYRLTAASAEKVCRTRTRSREIEGSDRAPAGTGAAMPTAHGCRTSAPGCRAPQDRPRTTAASCCACRATRSHR